MPHQMDCGCDNGGMLDIRLDLELTMQYKGYSLYLVYAYMLVYCLLPVNECNYAK